jgi:hypothetical protein
MIDQNRGSDSARPMLASAESSAAAAAAELMCDLAALIASGLIVPCQDARGLVRYAIGDLPEGGQPGA